MMAVAHYESSPRSHPVPVVEEFHLAERWAGQGLAFHDTLPTKNQAYLLLKKRLRVVELKHGDLYQIAVATPSAKESVEIANQIATSYVAVAASARPDGLPEPLRAAASKAVGVVRFADTPRRRGSPLMARIGAVVGTALLLGGVGLSLLCSGRFPALAVCGNGPA